MQPMYTLNHLKSLWIKFNTHFSESKYRSFKLVTLGTGGKHATNSATSPLLSLFVGKKNG
jgi:hypothetical protein